MDKRTRVFAAMDKQPVDHVPVGFWYHFAGEQAVGEGCVAALAAAQALSQDDRRSNVQKSGKIM